MKRLAIAIVLTAALGAPAYADKVKSGNAPQTNQTGSGNPPKSIESPGGKTVKSAPFEPVTVTFPNKTSRNQPAGGNRASGGRRR
jgi:hypothetical protein